MVLCGLSVVPPFIHTLLWLPSVPVLPPRGSKLVVLVATVIPRGASASSS